MISKIKETVFTVSAVASLLIFSVNEADTIVPDTLIIQESLPWLVFDDTDSSSSLDGEWLMRGYTDYFRLYDSRTTMENDSPVLSFHHSANSTHSLEVDSSGDINLANGSVFIDRSTNEVGIGTSLPEAMLDVRGNIHASFNGNSTKGLQQLFRMSAYNSNLFGLSDVGFVMENAALGFSWAFRTEHFDRGFSASKQGTGDREFTLINTTNVAKNVELRLASGAKNVGGQWLNASSRSYKKNIHELSDKDAMETLNGLKSVTYQFKHEDNEEKMVGFIAEDVPELLATKDRKTVDPLQIVAVLTKVVQEQNKVLLDLDAENQRKTNLLNMFEKRFEDMEKLLNKLKPDSSID